VCHTNPDTDAGNTLTEPNTNRVTDAITECDRITNSDSISNSNSDSEPDAFDNARWRGACTKLIDAVAGRDWR
jgi:hypothetical protein